MDRTRASDTERETAAGILRAAAAEGRLDTDELEERVASAYAARTRGELTTLLDDLPHGEQLPAARPRRKPSRIPGRIGFTARWRAPVSPGRATADLREFVAPPMRAYGYELIDREPGRLVFVRRFRPIWTYALAVVVFPLGLLALLHSEQERITLELVERGDETVIIAQGTAPLKIRRALSELER